MRISGGSADTESVLLLGADRDGLAAVLARLCPIVLACAAAEQAQALYDRHAPPLVVLAGEAGDIDRLARHMRERDAGVGILALGDFPTPQARAQLLLAGADGCLPYPPDQDELLAMVQALMRRPAGRRRGRAASGAGARSPVPEAVGDAQWTLRAQGWELWSPGGVRIKLTTFERALLLRLWESPVREAARADLMGMLAGMGIVGQADATPMRQSRAVDILVSRLRSKGRRLGVEIPLQSLYGYGYAFAA